MNNETDLIELERERLIVIPRQYTLDFQELARKTTTATKRYDQMLARYPKSLNRAGIMMASMTMSCCYSIVLVEEKTVSC